MSIEEQIRKITNEEVEPQLIELEERVKEYVNGEIEQIREQLSETNSRIELLEKEVKNGLSLFVRLRKYTLEQLMSEYNRLVEILRPGKTEPAENAEVNDP
jgi:hypothetical protein